MLAIDLYCGLGGWAEGLLVEGWDVVGFDIEQHRYWMPENPETQHLKNTKPIEKRGWTQGCAVSLGLEDKSARPRTVLHEYPAQLVLQDVLTLHGSQFKTASLIVASPPCQAYSYRAMPWSRAKALPPPDNTLFDACFRIQQEACEAAGRHIPLIVENVRGAVKWVSQPVKWHFGSYYLWGDVPALMPFTFHAPKRALDDVRAGKRRHCEDGLAHGFHPDLCDKCGFACQIGHVCPKIQRESNGVKQAGISGPRNNGKGDKWFQDGAAQHGSKSNSRKAASAHIAKIPFPLARHIAAVFREYKG